MNNFTTASTTHDEANYDAIHEDDYYAIQDALQDSIAYTSNKKGDAVLV